MRGKCDARVSSKCIWPSVCAHTRRCLQIWGASGRWWWWWEWWWWWWSPWMDAPLQRCRNAVWCIMSTSASPPLFNYFSRAIGAFRCNQRPSDRNLEIWNFTPFYLFIYSCIFGLIKRPVGGLKWADFHSNQKALKTTCSAFPHLLNVFLNKLHIRCIPMNEVFFFLVSLPHDLRRMSRCGLNGMQLRRDCKGWTVRVCVFQRCPNRPVLCEGRCSGVSGLNIL